MLRILALAWLVLLLLAACGAPATYTPTDAPDGWPAVTVYKSPT